MLAFWLSAAALVMGGAAEAGTYTFVQLNVSGSVETKAKDINDSGVVVGFYINAGGSIHGYSYTDGGTLVGYPDVGMNETKSMGNNNANEVAGKYWTPPSAAAGFHDDGTTIATISVPGSAWTSARDINNNNPRDIVGNYSDVPSTSDVSSFRYDGTNFSTFKKPGSTITRAEGINDGGIIVGYYTELGSTFGFSYDGVNFTQISVPGATETSARAIDNAGNIAGRYIDSLGNKHGFLYDGSTYETVDVDFAGGYDTAINGINELGQIVGNCKIGAGGDKIGFVASPPSVPVPSVGPLGIVIVSSLLGLSGLAAKRGCE